MGRKQKRTPRERLPKQQQRRRRKQQQRRRRKQNRTPREPLPKEQQRRSPSPSPCPHPRPFLLRLLRKRTQLSWCTSLRMEGFMRQQTFTRLLRKRFPTNWKRLRRASKS